MFDCKRKMAVALLLAVFFILSSTGIASKSATFDEIQYLGIGKYLMVKHRWDVMGSILHPPVSYYLNSIPLLFVDEPQQLWEYPGTTKRDLEFLGAVDVYRGQELLQLPANTGDRLLISSRMMILLTGLLLGFYVYRFSSALFGAWGGFLSLSLYVFCPNMLAYSGLILPDMPLAAFSFISIYYLWRASASERLNDWLLAAMFLGLALLSKFTSLLLIPVILALCALPLRYGRRYPFGQVALLLIVAASILYAGYLFQITPYLQGIAYQQTHALEGHVSFLMGYYSDHGWWYYFPIVFFLKTTIPVIILTVLASVLLFRCRHCNGSWQNVPFLLLPAAVIFAFFTINHQSIGLRYLLPIYPFVFVFIGCLSGHATLRKLAIGMVVLHLASALHATPDFLAYSNEIIGGPGNGYKYLVDSNLDWGQDLKGLKKFMERNGIGKISLSYFGADSPQRYGIAYDWLPSYHLVNPQPDKPVDVFANRWLAISATNLQGVYFPRREEFAWLKGYEPVKKIGSSIFIYDLSRTAEYRQQKQGKGSS